ncbi:MAG: thioredoxin domain-containing protein [Patescibacteria group bacterium]
MKEQNSEKINKLVIPLSIIISGVVIAGAIYFSSEKSTPSVVANSNQEQQVVQQQELQQQPSLDANISKVKISGQPFVGNPNAPVTLAFWWDYQCSFSKQLESEVIKQIIKEYPDKVKIVFKDFQFYSADSQTAGIVARAVFEVAPDKYFDWRVAIYEKQNNKNSNSDTKNDILAITKTILGTNNADRVARLIVSKQAEYQKALDDDKAEGKTFGTEGTPATMIGKQFILGAQPYSTFKQAIDIVLQEK